MVELFFLFLFVLALTLALAALVVGLPARPGIKAVALGLAAALLGGFYLAGSELLGRPKPARLTLLERAADEVTVVGSLNLEGQAIFLWLVVPEQPVPRAYSLPWSVETAEALRKAQGEAEANGTRVRMRGPFSNGATDPAARFYAPPPPPMPPKT